MSGKKPGGKVEVRDTGRLRKLQLDLSLLEKHALTVGIHAKEAEQRYPDGTPLIVVALAHELGLGVPRRSFIADWFDLREKALMEELTKMARAVAEGKVPDAETALNRLGLKWAADIRERIRAGIPPPLSPATIARRKKPRPGKGTPSNPEAIPLSDTGQLKGSITHSVEPKK